MKADGNATARPIQWRCVNKRKNEPLTILFYCTWSGKKFPVPANTENNYYEEPSGDDEGVILGSTTLEDAVKCLKVNDPTLFLMEECGGIEMHCGQNTVCGSEWEKTMLWHLVYDQPDDEIPRVSLDDGRQAVVITLGTKGGILKKKPSVVTRCLSKGDVYG